MSIAQDRIGRHARTAKGGLWLALLLLAGLALAAGAAGPARADERLTVVELFTSQGCSSCPKAEAFLGELTARPGILALSFHVDDWDYIGWRDPFADPAFTRRQKRYLKKLNLPYVYTPQIVVDGEIHASGNRPGEVTAAIAQARTADRGRVEIRLDMLSDDEVRVRIPAAAPVYRSEADIVLVRFDRLHVTEVTAGENAGRTLENYHVVRAARPISTWNGEAVDDVMRMVEFDGPPPDYCAVLVQERGQGRILGAAVLDMRKGGS